MVTTAEPQHQIVVPPPIVFVISTRNVLYHGCGEQDQGNEKDDPRLL
jgi:hypothetical protein